mmetsp:Transcript_13304/g.41512  ORF Transcript_13304/g.41512 Transcript_13304/m.41512 type:complete len:374 (-) Transcript_13304:407-1528(-)
MVLTLLVDPEECIVNLQVWVHEAEEAFAKVLGIVGPVADATRNLVQQVHLCGQLAQKVLLLDVRWKEPRCYFRDKLDGVVHPPLDLLCLLGPGGKDALHGALHVLFQLLRRGLRLRLLLVVLLRENFLAAAHARVGRGLEDLPHALEAALLVPGRHARHGAHQGIVGFDWVLQLKVLVLAARRMYVVGRQFATLWREGNLLGDNDVVGGLPRDVNEVHLRRPEGKHVRQELVGADLAAIRVTEHGHVHPPGHVVGGLERHLDKELGVQLGIVLLVLHGDKALHARSASCIVTAHGQLLHLHDPLDLVVLGKRSGCMECLCEESSVERWLLQHLQCEGELQTVELAIGHGGDDLLHCLALACLWLVPGRELVHL